MPNIIGKRTFFLSLSAVLVILSILALAVFGLKSGIDFSAGSLLTVAFDTKPATADLKTELATLGYSDVVIQTTGSGDFLIRLNKSDIGTAGKNALLAGLQAKFGTAQERGFESIDPIIARQSTRVAAEAVGLSAVGILAYLTWAFRKMPRPLHYGNCAVIAILHDVLVVLGIFAVLGAIFGWEIDLVFLIGVMTVIGYSTNNTVVVFDRIRENVLRGVAPTFDGAVNRSVIETIVRSVNSSTTVIISGLALMLFVGAAIQNLAMVMMIGIIVGTYDSLFVAPAILVIWDNFDKKRLAPRVAQAGT
jgi:preprotein translocase subunit SecF